MKFNHSFIFVLFIWVGCSRISPSPTVLDLPIPKSYVIYSTNNTITVDGIAREADWAAVPWTDPFIDIKGDSLPIPYYDTRIKMLWDENYLYVFAALEEEHVWADITQRDAVIFHNNDFEVFIKPNQFQPYYAEFEVNALGTLWELFLARPYRRNGPVLNHWDLNETKLGIDINGSLNDPSDVDQSWNVEMAIPIKAIGDIDRGAKFGVGSTWRINFSRVQWEHEIINDTYHRKRDGNGLLIPENNWVWSPQYAVDMHRPEHWGYLHFAEKSNNEVANDTLKSEYQLLFHLYRKQLAWKVKTGTFTDIIKNLDGPHYTVQDKRLYADLTLTKLGFEITVTNQQKQSLTINQNGYILLTP